MEASEKIIKRAKLLRMKLAETNQLLIEDETDFTIVSTALKNLEIDLILQTEKKHGKV